MPRRGPYILTRADGRLWFTDANNKQLSKQWRAHARAVGIDDLQFRDMRGTAVTLLSEAGVTVQQVAAITGHTMQSVVRILEKYSARTKRLAEAAIRTFEASSASDFANRLQTRAHPPKEDHKDDI